MSPEIEPLDWYERRGDLEDGQVFSTADGVVKLDRRVPGDGTKWYVQTWYGSSFSCDDGTIEPGDLIERLPDDYAGEAAKAHA